jgi:hypothetical protein
MTIFFFHIRRGDRIYVDIAGTELLDLAAAMSYAEQDAIELGHWEARATGQWTQIEDELGVVVGHHTHTGAVRSN